jgi:hypothetical protein
LYHEQIFRADLVGPPASLVSVETGFFSALPQAELDTPVAANGRV